MIYVGELSECCQRQYSGPVGLTTADCDQIQRRTWRAESSGYEINNRMRAQLLRNPYKEVTSRRGKFWGEWMVGCILLQFAFPLRKQTHCDHRTVKVFLVSLWFWWQPQYGGKGVSATERAELAVMCIERTRLG